MRFWMTVLVALALPLQASALLDIDGYTGEYFISKTENGKPLVERRAGARMVKDHIHVNRLNQSLDRFLVYAHPEAPHAILSLYRDWNGQFYSYFRDYVTRAATSEDFDGRSFKEGITWVPVEPDGDGGFKFTFYPNDRGSRYRLRVALRDGKIHVHTTEPGSWVPIKVDYLLEK